MNYVDDLPTLNQKIQSLQLAVSTVDAGDAESDDILYANIVFSDGTRLYDPYNIPFFKVDFNGIPFGVLPSAGHETFFTIYVPPELDGLDRKLIDISEVFIRKEGSDGWFVGSVVLYANGHPLIGNSQANQFLDNDNRVLRLRDWSTRSFCVAPATPAEFPLLRSGYSILGPVIGQMSDTSAVVLYRVDREGTYHFRAIDTTNNVTVHDQTVPFSTTFKFELKNLQKEWRYDFDLKFVRAGTESVVPGAAGSLTTYPQEGSRRGTFKFAFGSCANPEEQEAQGAWTAIRALADPASTGPEKTPVRLFIHLGDTFYFYDHMTEEVPQNPESMHAAHISMRRNIEFLEMARKVPCCGIWDDHDFASDNTDSTALGDLRDVAVDIWRQYWGNQPLGREQDNLGLTTRISYGSVDVYLLDSRYYRNFGKGVFFGNEITSRVLDMIDHRGSISSRVVVLGTGSNWTHNYPGKENYGDER